MCMGIVNLTVCQRNELSTVNKGRFGIEYQTLRDCGTLIDVRVSDNLQMGFENHYLFSSLD